MAYHACSSIQNQNSDWDIVEYNFQDVKTYDIGLPTGLSSIRQEILLNAECTSEYTDPSTRAIGFASKLDNEHWDPESANYFIEIIYLEDGGVRIFIRGHLAMRDGFHKTSTSGTTWDFYNVPDGVDPVSHKIIYKRINCNNNDIRIVIEGTSVDIYWNDAQLVIPGGGAYQTDVVSHIDLIGYPTEDPETGTVTYDTISGNQYLRIGRWYGGISTESFWGTIHYFKYRESHISPNNS